MDYGDFYGSELFKKLFPDFDRHQQKAAEDLWARILGRCGVDIGMPPIDFLIDLGCGEGTLTRHISVQADFARVSRGESPLIIIGIDSSASSITRATSIRGGSKNTTFLCWNDGPEQLFAELQRDHGVVWSRAALVCLSHTWFHLDQDSILSAINRFSQFRPALLLIDIYHNWDSTLARLAARNDNQGEPLLESGCRDNEMNCTYWLGTRRHPTNETLVERGIWGTHTQSQGCEVLPDGWLLTPTVQHALPTTSLFGLPLEASDTDIFSESRKQGSITGDESGDYITRKIVPHISGWGEMECYALVPREARAKCVNYAYFDVVRLIVRRLFVEDASIGRITNLRNLLELYDEPSDWEKKTRFSGSRAALIVLPFDPHTHFARELGLFAGAPDTVISKIDLIVEVPKETQFRFPTAYGVFHTFEDRVSSPQAFPLDWASDYEHAPIDEAFNALEAVLLGLRRADGTTIEFLDKRSPSYFLLPVYFGSLPLFALALKFPILFAPESTDYQVYFSAITNLHSEIKVALTDECIQTELLSPWIASALDALIMHDTDKRCAGSRSELKEADAVEELLNELEEKVFGTVVSGEADSDPRHFNLQGNRRIGGVLGKDWKSWVLGVPSFPIRHLRSVEAENARLWNLWQEEKKRALLNHEMRISYWFEEGDFFCDLGHDCWLPDPHRLRLDAMLNRFKRDPSATPADVIDSLHQHLYFARSESSYLLLWAQSQLRILQANDDVTNNARSQDAFHNLKATFCKTWENTGDGMRFSWRRLEVHLRAAVAASSVDVTFPPAIGESDHWHKFQGGPNAKYFNRGDPTVPIGELVHALSVLNCLASITASRASWNQDTLSGAALVTLKLNAALSDASGGTDFNQVRKHAGCLLANKDASAMKSAICQWLYGKSELGIGLHFSLADATLVIQSELK